MSILYVSARYPPFVGGTEVHTYEVATRMAGRGHDVTVLTTAFDPLPTATEMVNGVRVVRVRAWPADEDIYFAPAMYGFIRGRRWDIVHCQGYHTMVAPFAMAAAVSTHQPLVVTFHSGGHSSRLRRVIRPAQRAMLRPLLSRADRLIGVSQFETDFFRRHLRLPASRFVTITNGVSPEFLGNDADLSRQGTTICSVGRLQRYKGHQRVISALPEVRRVLGDVRLRVVGEGPYRSELVALAGRLGVDDAVEFITIDPSDRRGMANVFRTSDLATLLSDYESQGLVGLEALAAGCPLLVTDGTALAELNAYGDVSIVPPHVDGRELGALIAQQIRRGMTPPAKQVPMWEHTVDAIAGVYGDVLRQRRSLPSAVR